MKMPAINWDDLNEQKRDLVILIDNRREHYEEDDSVNESLLGILHMIDAMQDIAVEAGAWELPRGLDEYPSIGNCVVCHKPLYDHMGPTLVDDTEGDICEDNQPHCLGFEAEEDDSLYCRTCGAHKEDHPDVA